MNGTHGRPTLQARTELLLLLLLPWRACCPLTMLWMLARRPSTTTRICSARCSRWHQSQGTSWHALPAGAAAPLLRLGTCIVQLNRRCMCYGTQQHCMIAV
jgi:hypothetical protein